jgi:aspartate aminotransferase
MIDIIKTKSPLSDLANNMAESETIKMAQMSRDLAAKGFNVINLTLGEPDFDTPAHIKEAAKKALDDGFTKYSPVPGLVELRQAIVEKFKRENNLHFNINQIVVSNGAKQCIANVCLALLNPGDEVLVLSPYWVSYWEIIRMTGATPIPVAAGIEQDFKPSVAQIEAAITDRTKMLIYSTPCNPTGSVFSKNELEAIAEMLGKYEDIYVVSDEIYEHINFSGEMHTSIGTFEPVAERTATINGFAKGFAMTGWRLGYLGAPEWLAKACGKIQGQFTSGANTFSQKAAVLALNAGLESTYRMRDEFLKRRDLVLQLMADIPGLMINKPQGAFYVFPEISNYFGKTDGKMVIRNADDLSEYIILNAHVGTVSGGAFGAPNCLRISYAASETHLREAIRRIREVLARLQ